MGLKTWGAGLLRGKLAPAPVAVASAVAAFWVTLDAHLLKYPGWLPVQKADFILGPVGVGLYWRYRRSDYRLGLLPALLGGGRLRGRPRRRFDRWRVITDRLWR